MYIIKTNRSYRFDTGSVFLVYSIIHTCIPSNTAHTAMCGTVIYVICRRAIIPEKRLKAWKEFQGKG